MLAPFIDGLQEITAIHIEYTPDGDVFNGQTGRGGVDCDVLVEGQTTRSSLVQVIETKFVEPEFSICGFRKAGRVKKGQDVCRRTWRFATTGASASTCATRATPTGNARISMGYWHPTPSQLEGARSAALDGSCG